MWLILGAISVGWKVLVFTVGAAVPRWLITDGIEQLPTPLRAYGLQAKRTALTLWNGPLERHGLVRTVRVMSVHVDGGIDTVVDAAAPSAGAPVTVASSDAATNCGGHGAIVRAYTYFGIPYSEARIRCDTGVVEYRIFRRRKPAETP